MRFALFLFIAGLGVEELIVGFVLFPMIGFFIWRALLNRVLKKGAGSVNAIAIVGGFITAPAFFFLFGLIFFWMITWNQPEMEALRAHYERDTTEMPSTYFALPDSAHENARALMTAEFYWSPIEETSPFGNDEGSDAFYGFLEWRETNKTRSPAIYVDELIEEWGYTRFPLSTIQPNELAEVLDEVSPSHVVGIDNAIIAIGFGQFVLEGTIDPEIHQLSTYALQRQLSPALISRFNPVHQATRKANLQKMLLDLEQMD